MVATSTQDFLLATHSGAGETDRMAASSQGRALGLITRGGLRASAAWEYIAWTSELQPACSKYCERYELPRRPHRSLAPYRIAPIVRAAFWPISREGLDDRVKPDERKGFGLTAVRIRCPKATRRRWCSPIPA